MFRYQTIKIRPFHMAITLAIAASVFLLVKVKINLTGHHEGIYLLNTREGTYNLTDDAFLGDEKNILFSVPFQPLLKLLRQNKCDSSLPFLEYEWLSKDGCGFVKNIYPDGKKMLICFSRFRDDAGQHSNGVFVGGSLPYSENSDPQQNLNETGMAYYDGKNWLHLWCNVNEGIGNGNRHDEFYPPSQWRFLDSYILKADCTELILASRHSVTVGGTPLRIDRFGFIKAGCNYLVLLIKISNMGTATANYYYTYGDEPWLGDFGSSAGNVGWVNGRILNSEETIDAEKYSSAGFFDYGNSAIGEGHNFSGIANFIDWRWGEKPDLVYISNQPKKVDSGSSKIPLFSNSRFIGLQWGPQTLRPGEAMTYTLTIGMADKAPISGFPLTPDIKFSFSGIEMLLR